jgi:hypothetical protein
MTSSRSSSSSSARVYFQVENVRTYEDCQRKFDNLHGTHSFLEFHIPDDVPDSAFDIIEGFTVVKILAKNRNDKFHQKRNKTLNVKVKTKK